MFAAHRRRVVDFKTYKPNILLYTLQLNWIRKTYHLHRKWTLLRYCLGAIYLYVYKVQFASTCWSQVVKSSQPVEMQFLRFHPAERTFLLAYTRSTFIFDIHTWNNKQNIYQGAHEPHPCISIPCGWLQSLGIRSTEHILSWIVLHIYQFSKKSDGGNLFVIEWQPCRIVDTFRSFGWCNIDIYIPHLYPIRSNGCTCRYM